MKPTFFIHTTGCRANQWDTSVIAGNLARAGYAPAPVDKADLVVVNACTVTEGAVRDIRRFISRLRRDNPGAKVVLAGCHGQAYPDHSFGADLVLGQAEKVSADRYADLAGTFVSPRESLVMEDTPEEPAMAGKTRFFFKIQDGCDRFCSYCIVPYARGLPRSRPLAEILGTMETLARKGIQEVVLTGIEISAWRDQERGIGVTELIRLLEDVPTPVRIRLSSVDPLMFNEAFIETAAASRKLAKSFHIPLQSGSDAVLTAMRRPYRQSDIRRILDKVLEKMPDAGIGMDVIAGFPGEDEALFEETRAFLDSCPVYYLHVFPFSLRPGTAAAVMGGMIAQATKKQRVRVLKEIDAHKRETFHRRFAGSRAWIIPEGKRYLGRYMRGYTNNYMPVHIPYDKELENKMVPVRIDRVEGPLVVGKALCEDNDQ
ncbi:MAG: MiaB/RimO family radical SAM methylthiotransferase [Syntrophorhabdaceae bacterium]|nr:MiaB/RimO family radical SAM methylthiotransferase [Syntrophorhabdaceae bacterium]